MNTSWLRRWVGFALGVALIGCGDGTDDTPEATDEQREAITVCAFDFTADVRSGPSAPLRLGGRLELARPDGLNLIGRLMPPEESGEPVLVTGQAADDRNEIGLFFWLRDGSVIHGTGALSAPFANCADNLIGDLTGPREGDAGDWAGIGPVMYNTCVVTCGAYIPPNSTNCSNICSSLPNPRPGNPDFDACRAECLNNPFQFPACGGSTSFFDPYRVFVAECLGLL